MNREQALNLIHNHVKNANSVKHMLATEAIMKALARKFDEDEVVWAMAGLIHDLDMEIHDYREDPSQHGLIAAQMLEKEGVSSIITEAIKAHNEETGKKRETKLEKAIYCADPLTGLIVAATLVLPSKNLADLKVKSVLKRFKENHFARGANREIISKCSELGLTLEEFVEIGLKAMQEISSDLGLSGVSNSPGS